MRTPLSSKEAVKPSIVSGGTSAVAAGWTQGASARTRPRMSPRAYLFSITTSLGADDRYAHVSLSAVAPWLARLCTFCVCGLFAARAPFVNVNRGSLLAAYG